MHYVAAGMTASGRVAGHPNYPYLLVEDAWYSGGVAQDLYEVKRGQYLRAVPRANSIMATKMAWCSISLVLTMVDYNRFMGAI